MTLISQIITDAYREPNLIAVGTTETTAEQTEGLRLLNRYVRALFGGEVGDPLENMLYGFNGVSLNTINRDFERFVDNHYLPQGFRLKLNMSEAKTIKLTPNPEDGARFAIVDASGNLGTYNLTIDGNGSTIEDAAGLTLSTNGYTAEWFYRSDTANWHRVTDLTTADASPFPEEFDDLLIIGLAARLDPRNGANLPAMSQGRYQEVMRKFRSRYSQVQERTVDRALAQIQGGRTYSRAYSWEGEFERGGYGRW